MADVVQEAMDDLRYLFPGWPDEALRVYAEEWIETGDTELALARARATEAYAQAFPGMVRDDGSLRFSSEQEYFAARTLFDAEIESIGLNPEPFGQTFVDLLEAEVGPREMISRIEATYERVLDRAPEFMAEFAAVTGIQDVSPQAVLASFLDPRVGQQIIDRRIGIAEISSEAAIRDFDIDLDLAARLYEVGVTQAQSREAFGDAAEVVPIISALARRHNDPDDDFDINEFASAQLLDDPFQRRRMRRLLAQERAQFRAVTPFAISATGAVRGLVPR